MALFLVCHDYGMGGIWLYVEAESAGRIREEYKDLIVYETPPPWWTDEMEAHTKTKTSADPFWRNWLDTHFKR